MVAVPDSIEDEKEVCGPDLQVSNWRLKKFYVKLFYRAVCDYVNYKNAKKARDVRIYEEAKDWLFCTDSVKTKCPPDQERHECWTQQEIEQADRWMSFETICGTLNWDIDWIRQKIRQLTKADLERIGKNGVL